MFLNVWYPVGRLDYDTSGLLILTNDGDFANQMMHPHYKVDKTYVAKVEGLITPDSIKKLRNGVVIDENLQVALGLKFSQEMLKRILQ